VSRARANPPLSLKVLPPLEEKFPARAASLGLGTSTLLAALVWNDALAPGRTLQALDASRVLKRRPLGVSLRAPIKRLARQRARALGLSLNAYLEALIATQALRTSALVIYPAR
jgi:hypothetical protein